MKKTLSSIAVIAAALIAASCQKENFNEGESASSQSSPQFSATIEKGAVTKTTVERVESPSVAYKVKWEDNEEININGAIYQATPKTDATKADFTLKSGQVAPMTTPYKAYFPASMFDGNTATLPATYTYADGSEYANGKYDMPMYAQGDNMDLSFRNICGVLAITVEVSAFDSVSSIEVSSDQRMNGAFTADADGTLAFTSQAAPTAAEKKVTLRFTEAKAIQTSETFYVPVPAGIHNPLHIKVSGTLSGTEMIKVMFTKKSGGVQVVRNTVYPATFAGSSPNYVEMGGKRWATRNLGATTIADCYETCAGDYYQWGSVSTLYKSVSWSGASASFNWKDGKSEGFVTGNREYALDENLPDERDVVKRTIGKGWRMPAKEDFEALYAACTDGGTTTYPVVPDGTTPAPAKCIYWLSETQADFADYTGVAGLLFVADGKELFFPAAGLCYEAESLQFGSVQGYYWSVSAVSSGKAASLSFQEGGVRDDFGNNREYGASVRPVMDLPNTPEAYGYEEWGD